MTPADVAMAELMVFSATNSRKMGYVRRTCTDRGMPFVHIGESTGALPAMLNSVAEFYEEDVQTALGASMALIEPIILIVMAIFVGGVLISLYLPIFTLGVH